MDSISAIKEMQGELLKRVPWLNNGGCIHFAHYASEALKRQGIAHRVVLANTWCVPIYNSYKNFDPVSHVFLYIKGIGYFDGHEFITEVSMRYSIRRSTKLDLNRLRSNYEWSPLYDVERYNPIVESVVNKYLEW